jgi:tRNA dimethylallyltransferase
MIPTVEPALVITGATATGKSALAIEVARRLDGEIISADSRQVYRYMDLGTAKPPLQVCALVPHHLLDVVYPDQVFSVAEYRALAESALVAIQNRGRLPVIVGGSPHYIQALVDRLEPPRRDARLRTWLEDADRAGLGSQLDRWLEGLDPASASAIDGRNRRRVLRAIEATLVGGEPFSVAGRRRGASVPALWVGLAMDRGALYTRVAHRLSGMMEAGWSDEVRVLLAMGFSAQLPSMSATGYRQIVRTIRGQTSADEARERIEIETHAFIRRQETWLRAEPRIHWLPADDPSLPDRVVSAWCSFRHNQPTGAMDLARR